MAPTLDLTGLMAITGDQRGQSQQTVAPTLDLTGRMAITGDQRGQSQQQVKYSERLKPTYYIQTEEPTIHGYILTLFFDKNEQHNGCMRVSLLTGLFLEIILLDCVTS